MQPQHLSYLVDMAINSVSIFDDNTEDFFLYWVHKLPADDLISKFILCRHKSFVYKLTV